MVSTRPAGTPARLNFSSQAAAEPSRLDQRLQRRAVLLADLAFGKARVRCQPRLADQPAERDELLLLVGGDVEQAVAGAKRTGGRRRHVLIAHRLWLDAGRQVVGHRPAERRQRTFEHRDIEKRALA
jgi:hypothetical protein